MTAEDRTDRGALAFTLDGNALGSGEGCNPLLRTARRQLREAGEDLSVTVSVIITPRCEGTG